MTPAAQVALPDDRVRVWVVVFDGRWPWDSRAVDVEADRDPGAFM